MTCRWCSESAMPGDTLCYAHGERAALIEYGSTPPISRAEAERLAQRTREAA